MLSNILLICLGYGSCIEKYKTKIKYTGFIIFEGKYEMFITVIFYA